jgi:uncharacterized protein
MTQLATRPVTFQSGDLSLEAALHLPDVIPAPGVVVCHPHPLYGGDMDNNVVMAACESMVSRGVAALRFNFRGAGASEGTFDDGDGEREDVRSALTYIQSLPEIDPKRLGLIGYSFGGMVAAEVASGALRGLALISPLLAFGDLRVAWGCPAMIIAGDVDALVPPDRLQVLSEAPGVEAHVFEGADHSWWGYEDELSEMLGSFFANHFR